MLKVEVKGTGDARRWTFKERVVISEEGALIGESELQNGSLLAPAGRVLTVGEAEALGIASLLDAAIKPKSKSKPTADSSAKPTSAKSRRKRK
tara:strand:+ start:220 stop:498 length:279 start_codon:yes stop_codon:yes gene_type:complete